MTTPNARMRLLLGTRGIRIRFSDAAMACIDAAGTDVDADLRELESGGHTRESLLAHCLDGAGDDRAEGWRDYVSALCDAV